MIDLPTPDVHSTSFTAAPADTEIGASDRGHVAGSVEGERGEGNTPSYADDKEKQKANEELSNSYLVDAASTAPATTASSSSSSASVEAGTTSTNGAEDCGADASKAADAVDNNDLESPEITRRLRMQLGTLAIDALLQMVGKAFGIIF